jgi:glycerophosphoryl diester phosphodiesterase
MQVIGHRGAAALAPENTWPGFDVALKLGVDAVETDVRATSDGVLVLLHDARLDRTTDATGRVHETAWAVVHVLDAGSWFGTEYAGAGVPRLDETLARYGRRTHLVLEIKQPGVEGQVLEEVRLGGLLGQVTFTSFDFAAVSSIKGSCPEARVGYLARDMEPGTVARVLDAGLDQVCPPARALSPELVSEWKALGLEVRAWGVRDANLMRAAIEAGVDGMTVDFPHLLLEALGRGRFTCCARRRRTASGP